MSALSFQVFLFESEVLATQLISEHDATDVVHRTQV